MILLLLAACEAPGTLASVSAILADDVVAVAEPPMRHMTALSGLLAETCGVDAVDEHLFVGRSAVALGAELARVERSDEAQTWSFSSVGLDGVEGELVLDTDATQRTFAVHYVAPGLELEAALELAFCDAAGGSAVVGGGGTWTSGLDVVTLTLLDAATGQGVTFAPPLADVPTAGQLRGAEGGEAWTVLLDDASTLEPRADAWTGVASGEGFTADVAIDWP